MILNINIERTMSVFLDRVFGSCFRSWVWCNSEVGQQKYIDYLPSRKWRYNDENLMHDLNDNNSWDVMDLTDDDWMNSKTPKNIQLRLHDNVFINPIDVEEDFNSTMSVLKIPAEGEHKNLNEEEIDEEEIVVDTLITERVLSIENDVNYTKTIHDAVDDKSQSNISSQSADAEIEQPEVSKIDQPEASKIELSENINSVKTNDS